VPRILNTTKNTVVAQQASIARTVWSRFWGLMGKGSLPDGHALVIDPCSSVHTMFMRFAIDAVFLDKNNRVVKVARSMHPYRAAIAPGAARVLELQAGGAERARLEEGDILALVD